ncbi:transmembrane protein, putative (macronuclear) [Tetrahymena thermophila SB210]|uniref:Transmembrane protein, putative n=1 Tax=Tetrahymena thermophila (strain SB210) TaxID=312017 RepID=W7XGY1_TETTS|nr:transmembrane protein, putative [Tetrahymena thermophila SB210]EWS76318.1 transmembrane protein, putative [Tetrahymena thermophila SB210]|eukprot:XP_012651102.1 transmembrane protein, putative [Tetrahymena thermophila SB210]
MFTFYILSLTKIFQLKPNISFLFISIFLYTIKTIFYLLIKNKFYFYCFSNLSMNVNQSINLLLQNLFILLLSPNFFFHLANFLFQYLSVYQFSYQQKQNYSQNLDLFKQLNFIFSFYKNNAGSQQLQQNIQENQGLCQLKRLTPDHFLYHFILYFTSLNILSSQICHNLCIFLVKNPHISLLDNHSSIYFMISINFKGIQYIKLMYSYIPYNLHHILCSFHCSKINRFNILCNLLKILYIPYNLHHILCIFHCSEINRFNIQCNLLKILSILCKKNHTQYIISCNYRNKNHLDMLSSCCWTQSKFYMDQYNQGKFSHQEVHKNHLSTFSTNHYFQNLKCSLNYIKYSLQISTSILYSLCHTFSIQLHFIEHNSLNHKQQSEDKHQSTHFDLFNQNIVDNQDKFIIFPFEQSVQLFYPLPKHSKQIGSQGQHMSLLSSKPRLA